MRPQVCCPLFPQPKVSLIRLFSIRLGKEGLQSPQQAQIDSRRLSSSSLSHDPSNIQLSEQPQPLPQGQLSIYLVILYSRLLSRLILSSFSVSSRTLSTPHAQTPSDSLCPPSSRSRKLADCYQDVALMPIFFPSNGAHPPH